MNIKILLFGRLTELLGQSVLHMEDVSDTNTLAQRLSSQYPGLAQIKYQVAVNQEIIHGNKALTDGMTVALMPPFSGG
ncbi:MoaD/ThiS family protein [Pedobacter sp. MC2016-15]|uniref:MoaD/ThiS family protein n=1 Tax=Pedobacter sp. MC2016-15 TaxID=2994473 RepID=UPI0022458BC6|nr:MoaD/ThiS family protein [Pedobacter sp. MC2016-15]MCX2481765.1 MoaD/ThiS family protein [Pedobacter sp. MC2016-15]